LKSDFLFYLIALYNQWCNTVTLLIDKTEKNVTKKENVTREGNIKDQYSPALMKLLEIVNLAPSDAEFLSWSELEDMFTAHEHIKLSREDYEEYSDNYWELMSYMNAVVLDHAARYPKLKEYLAQSEDSSTRYFDFLGLRRKVYQLIHEAVYFIKTGKEGVFVPESPVSFWLSYNFSKNKKFNFEPDLVVTALQDVDIDRLRFCEVCKNVFFANRKEKIGCSDKCNQVLRTRKRRMKEANRFESRVEKPN